jgi:hypothetical protein
MEGTAMRILFIGNSHTYFNDLPELVRKACAQRGQKIEVCMLTHRGKGLDFHADEPQTRFNILFGGWDRIILQHCAHPIGDLAALKQGLEIILSWTHQAGSQALLFQTWARKGDEAAQQEMSGIYRELGEQYGLQVIPVGDRWQEHRRMHPGTELYAKDGGHAALAGSQLSAQVIAEALFPS